jgi:hypothetical protein
MLKSYKYSKIVLFPMPNELFGWAVEDYCVNILPRIVKHVNWQTGKVLDVDDDEPLGQKQENPYFSGRSIFFNGHYVKDKISQALEEGQTLEHIATEAINTKEEWISYFRKELKSSDRLYFFNGSTRELGKFKGQLKISDKKNPKIRKEIADYLPDEYVEIEEGTRIPGGRTISSALATTREYDVSGDDRQVEAIVLNQTAGKNGYGLLSRMANGRVVEDVIISSNLALGCPQLVYRQRDGNGRMVAANDLVIDTINELLYFKYGLPRQAPKQTSTEEPAYAITA